MAIPDDSESFQDTGNVILVFWINWSPAAWCRWRFWAVAAVLFVLTQSSIVSCSLAESPRNIVVVNGSSNVQLKCRSDQGYKLRWWMQSPCMFERQVLSDGQRLSKGTESFCRVENGEPGKFDLYLVAKEEAAQTYICEEPGKNNGHGADLIILIGTENLHCSKTVIDGLVILTCSVEFRGNWAPELEWSFNGTSIEEGVNSTIIPNKMVSSVLVLALNVSAGNYTCTARFDIKGKPLTTTATNVPNYVSTSVLTVEAKEIVSGDEYKQSNINRNSTGIVIGLLMTIIFSVAILTIIFCHRRSSLWKCRMCNSATKSLALHRSSCRSQAREKEEGQPMG